MAACQDRYHYFVDYEFGARIERLRPSDSVTLVPIALCVVGDDFAVGGDDLPAALACFVLLEMKSSLRLPFWRNGVCPACIQAFRLGYPAMRQHRKDDRGNDLAADNASSQDGVIRPADCYRR